MHPPIQYTRTTENVRIAFWAVGTGPPLIYLPPIPGHAQRDWERPEFRALFESLAVGRRLIRIDPRNTGLSQRRVENLSIEARQLDVQAVADRLELNDFVLFGHGGGASTAIGYTALHPDRVSKLILVDATVGFPDVADAPAVADLRNLVRFDWHAYTDAFAAYVRGGQTGRDTDAIAELLRNAQDWDDARRSLGTLVYASTLLHRLPVSTLVIHHDGGLLSSAETGRRLAQEIYDARLVSLSGRAILTNEVDAEMMMAIDEFLAHVPEVDEPKDRATMRAESGQFVARPPWDVFISHASEDKNAIARPLAELLRKRGLRVWLDRYELTLGDSLREKIDHGLANSRYGVVILSHSFFAKEWPTRELNGLLSLETMRGKVLLPVWHEVDHDYVARFSPILADKLAASTTAGLDSVADAILRAIASGDAPQD